MKVSEIYQFAMLAVLEYVCLTPGEKLDIVEQLLQDKSMAEWIEKREAEQE